ncbi:hypothetical protein ACH5RR_014053 [Cinchona calisaya]|uniref:BHLH domain-containing protein n=1 Tax=Cinchona calisaya TaxID=153742 RepID=A0ABD3A1S5_9GENT
MANAYDTAHCSSSSPDDPDDFSLFLHQIMLRSHFSSSSSSSSFMAQKGNEVLQSFSPSIFGLPGNQDCGFQLVSGPDRISAPVSSSAGLQQWPSVRGFASPVSGVLNVASNSSVSVGTVDNDLNDYDCESEGFEGAVEEAVLKPTAGRNAGKRSRVAEFHNLSEKRRRSRINEKMKALQNLIPNSNKTDKASMLDEAIEYLKQLQLQVQLLTVRNGLSLYPMCLPGVLQSNRLPETRMACEGDRSSNMRLANALPLNPATPTNILFDLSNNYNNPKQASIVNLPKSNDSEHAFAPESAMRTQHRLLQFPLPGSSEGPHAEEKLNGKQASQDLFRTRSVEDYVGAEATTSTTFNALASGMEENTLEACVLRRGKSGGRLLANMECTPHPLSQVDGTQTGRNP